MINVEKKRNTDKYYLTFKRVKIRYRDDVDISYFNHPFVEGNRMRLVDDIDLEEPLSEISLDSDFEGIVEFDAKKGRRTIKERPVEKPENDLKFVSEVFNFDKMVS